MARTLSKTKARRDSGTFLALPHAVLECENWRRLSPHALKLVIDLGTQFRGANNGDLCAAWSIMHKRGWRSKATLHKAIKEAIDRGMIMKTRQGGRNFPSLYALTWRGIDECGRKLDVAATKVPPGNWRGTTSTSTGAVMASPTAIRLPHGAGHAAPRGGAVPGKTVVH